jgi:hypothetical protein
MSVSRADLFACKKRVISRPTLLACSYPLVANDHTELSTAGAEAGTAAEVPT